MSMSTALSGLIAAQNDISTTSNNIANVGTNGFRKSRVQFADEFYTTPLGASRKAIGGGTHVQSVSVQFGQGNFMASGNTLDLAIQGSGFFSVGATMSEEGRAVEVAYTRSGAFNLNQEGQILDSLGRPMLTWPVAEDGTALEQSIAAARPVHVPTSRGVVKATENINLQMRLPSDDTMLNRQDAVPPTNAFDPTDPTTYTFTTTIPITDEAGDSMEAQAYFIKTDSPDATDPTSTFELRLYVDGVEQPAFGSPDSLIKFDEFGLVTPTDATVNMGTPQRSWNVSFEGSMLEPQTAAVKSAKHDGANSSGLSNLEVDESGTIWANYGIEDLLQVGYMGLIDASRRYQPKAGASFGSYAAIRVRGSIVDFLRDNASVCRSTIIMQQKAKAATAKLEQQLMRAPEKEEVAKELGITVGELEDWENRFAAGQVKSLDELYTDQSNLFSDNTTRTAEDNIQQMQMKKLLRRALGQLPEREALLLQLYYVEELNVYEIAEVLGVTTGRVSQIKKAAVERLRKFITEMEEGGA